MQVTLSLSIREVENGWITSVSDPAAGTNPTFGTLCSEFVADDHVDSIEIAAAEVASRLTAEVDRLAKVAQ